ncbi:MAG: B12-binding domain-containing radical SAM protein [Phycisphaerae bacterium]
MRVLLVKPNNLSDHIQPSLGLGYLAQQIRRHHDVDIFDCIRDGTTPEQLGKIVEATRPDVVGVQCYTFDIPNTKEILRIVKGINPEITTVVGGAHMSSDAYHAMTDFGADLDFGFGGEGELAFPVFLGVLEKRSRAFADVPGLVWRDGERTETNPQMLVEDLDGLGFPALDLIRPDTYPESQHGAFYEQFPISPIITTRGCPYSCTFCSAPIISGKKLRHHSVDYVRDLILVLYHRYGIREFHIVDDNFTMDIEYAKSVMRMIIALDLGISLAMPNGIRMDWLDDELLELMKAAGVYVVSIAVESGNDRILKAMKKSTTVAKIRENVARIRRHDLDIAAFFIVGFPGETRETIRDTVNLSLELDLLRANYFTYLPLPGTTSHARLVADGEIEKVDWDHFLFMSAAYVPKGMTRKELMNLKRIAFLRFHLRPRILIRILLAVRSWRHFKFLTRRFYHWVLMTPNPALGQIKDQRSWWSRLKARFADLFAEEAVPTMPPSLDRAAAPAMANIASLVPQPAVPVPGSANAVHPAAVRPLTRSLDRLGDDPIDDVVPINLPLPVLET